MHIYDCGSPSTTVIIVTHCNHENEGVCWEFVFLDKQSRTDKQTNLGMVELTRADRRILTWLNILGDVRNAIDIKDITQRNIIQYKLQYNAHNF